MPHHERKAEIDSSRIPLGRGAGAALAIALLLAGMLIDLPALRPVALWGAVLGVVLGAGLILWRR